MQLPIDTLPELLPPRGYIPASDVDPPTEDGLAAAHALVDVAVQAGVAGNSEDALRHLDSAEQTLEAGDEAGRLLVLANRAQALLDLGELAAAADAAASALRLARREKRDDWIALASVGVALTSLARGRRNDARTRLGEAVRLFQRFGDAPRQVQCHYLLGEVAWIGEDPIRAGSHYRDALAIARVEGMQAWIDLLTLRFEHR
jgi:tetratricopeptide (TPR) repeat protein